jgi:hypothetical protein
MALIPGLAVTRLVCLGKPGYLNSFKVYSPPISAIFDLAFDK